MSASAIEPTIRDALFRSVRLEPGGEIMAAIARRWATPPEVDEERRLLEGERDNAVARLADTQAARYERGEFASPDERPVYDRIVAKHRDAIARIDRDLAAMAEPDEPPEVSIRQLVDTWDSATTPERREILAVMCKAIVVTPAPRRGTRFHPNRRLVIQLVNGFAFTPGGDGGDDQRAVVDRLRAEG